MTYLGAGLIAIACMALMWDGDGFPPFRTGLAALCLIAAMNLYAEAL